MGGAAAVLLGCLPAGSAMALDLPLPSPGLPDVLPTPVLTPVDVTSPLPLPSLTPLPNVTPLPSVTPLPLPTSSPLPGSGTVPVIGGTLGGSQPTSNGGSGGPGGTTGTGGGDGAAPTGLIGAMTAFFSEPAAPSGSKRAPVKGPVLAGVVPLPAFPGLPAGAAQDIAWVLVLLIPVLLLVWVVSLVRALGRMTVWRNSSTLLAAAADLGLSPREIAGMSPAAIEKVREQLAVDELTGCMRRAAGVAALERELVRARREHSPLAVAFVDADGLKKANDSDGHAAGDALLRDISEALQSRVRGSDFVFRYGGDEFVAVMPGATARDAAEVVGEVQTAVRERGRSFSMGVSELQPGDDTVQLLARADEQLYAAKRALKIGREFDEMKARQAAIRSARGRQRRREMPPEKA